MNYNRSEFQSFNPNFQIPKRNNLNDKNDDDCSNSSQTDRWDKLNHDAYERNFYGHYEGEKTIRGKYGGGVFEGNVKNISNPKKRQGGSDNKPYIKHKVGIIESDKSLPEDLRKMFEPMKCKLCQADLTSTVMAKIHYGSNNHEKKIKKWLIEYSERTGEPLHKRVNAPSKTKVDDNNPKYFHCDLCDIPLTGRLHAESHYMGKSHLSVALGRAEPARKKGSQPEENLSCKVCQVSVTSQIQLEAHMTGSKHKKKLKAMETIDSETKVKEHTAKKLMVETTMTIDSSIVSDMGCNTCALTFNSKIQLVQHLQSKKHLKKLQKENEEKVTENPTESQESSEVKIELGTTQ